MDRLVIASLLSRFGLRTRTFDRRCRIALLACVILLPRLLRLASSRCWLEDTDYMHAALLISRGFAPFRDFPSPHFPLLEAALGALYAALGPSLRLAELFTQAALGLAAFLLYRAVAGTRGFAAGVVAAALFGSASLVFRYHLFEREVFTALCLAAGILVALEPAAPARRRVASLAGLGLLAALIKLTALVEWSALILFLWLGRGKGREALAVAAGLLLALLAAVTAAFWLAGDAFLAQVFLFHTLKGSLGTLWTNLRLLRLSLDLTGVLALAALGVLLAGDRMGAPPFSRRETILLASLFGFPAVFYLLLSPTFWPHNLIPVLLPLAWLGALFLLWLARSAAQALPRPDRTALHRALFAVGLVAVGFLVFPLRNDNWRMGSVFGFGFRDRAELSRVAAAVVDHAWPEDRIIAPPYVAVEAGRLKLVHYREVAGPMTMIQYALETGRLPDLRRRVRERGFFPALFDSSVAVGAHLTRAVETRSVPVVVPDARSSLVSETRVREDFLQANGYRPVLATDHYSVWVISIRDRTSPIR